MPTNKRERFAAFILSPEVQDALFGFKHAMEGRLGRRVTWDEAFRRLLAEARIDVKEEHAGSQADTK